MTVKYSRIAEGHLADIWQYTFEQYGEKQADSYVNAIDTYCSNLARRQTDRGGMATSRAYPSQYLPNVRIAQFKSIVCYFGS